MECSNAKCSITGNDRMVSCWLCTKHYHLKCSGLKARDADALDDPQKFLHWTCPCCRNISVEFYNLFKDSKAEFDKINKEFLVLQTKLSIFGQLFNNYPSLEKFVNSKNTPLPKNKNSNADSVEAQNCVTVISDQIADSIHSSKSDIRPPISNSYSPSHLIDTENAVLASHVESNCSPFQPYSSGPVTSVRSVNNNNLLLNCASNEYNVNLAHGLNQSAPVSNLTQVIPKPIRAIPPRKNIFVSRLASETTGEDVEFYIKSKLRTNCLMTVYKYVYSQPRSIVSFRITLPDEEFKHVVDPSFWPENTFVREYVFKERQRDAVRLPAAVTNVSKN